MTTIALGTAPTTIAAARPAAKRLRLTARGRAVLTALAALPAVIVILGVTDDRAFAGFAPLAIGMTLTVLHLVAIPVSNASFNPARSLATAVYGGPDALLQLWVFLVVPVVGAIVGAAIYRGVFAGKR